MGRSRETYGKKEREKKRLKKKKDKAERKEMRKSETRDGNNMNEMFMYVDEMGNLSPTPPDPLKKRVINKEDIAISVPKRGKSDESEFLRKGIVKFFNTEKGYGFITDSDSKDSVFVHVAELIDEITNNDKVTFEMGRGPKGPVAISVRLAVDPPKVPIAPKASTEEASPEESNTEEE